MPSPSLSNRFSHATGDAPILPLLLASVGGYIIWFAVHYWEDTKVIWPSDPVKSVLQGKGLPPHSTETTAAIELTSAEQSGAQSSGGSTGAAGSPSQIAQSYVGKLTYVFGGPPPAGTVDCSSFASKVLDQAGYPSPGGMPFNPSIHGPTTLNYLAWSGATTVGHDAVDAQENDLCVWQTHMGICIGGGKMVSARDPAEGVGVDTIEGDMPGEVLYVRRLNISGAF